MLKQNSLEFPQKTIRSIIRSEVPASTPIQPEAFLALSRACVVFTSYIAAIANEHSKIKNSGNSVISTADIEESLKATGFEQLVSESLEYVEKYNRSSKAKSKRSASTVSNFTNGLASDNKPLSKPGSTE